jgi:peptidoglycan/LPS O-acetylase OafA/YrhL
MVALFFFISGYVLSYRLLKNIRNRDAARFLDGLASSIFRRYLRLYGSTAVPLFIDLIMVCLHWDSRPRLEKPSFFAHQKAWSSDTTFFLNPFGTITGYNQAGVVQSKYVGVFWTIPVEFRGSIVLFGFLAAVCKLKTKSRMTLIWNAIYVAEFLLDMFIADLNLGRHPNRLGRARPLPEIEARPISKPQQILPRYAKTMYTMLFLIGIFILGQPETGTALGIWGDFPWRFLKSLARRIISRNRNYTSGW